MTYIYTAMLVILSTAMVLSGAVATDLSRNDNDLGFAAAIAVWCASTFGVFAALVGLTFGG